MILSFPKNSGYEESILSGRKKITIRKDKLDRWKPGIPIQFATGVRTKEYNCFLEGVVKKVEKIEIINKQVYVSGNLLTSEQLINLVYLDGYNDIKDFFNFFGDNYKGKIIFW
jgi:uncharacterized protein YqfB (UPF0267 family)